MLIQTLSLKKNEFENAVCKMAAILSWVQYVNSLRPSAAYMRKLSNHHWIRKWLVAWSAPSHYLNRCWSIVNCMLRNFSEILIQIHKLSFKKIPLKMSSGKMAAILSRPQCVKPTTAGPAHYGPKRGHHCICKWLGKHRWHKHYTNLPKIGSSLIWRHTTVAIECTTKIWRQCGQYGP